MNDVETIVDALRAIFQEKINPKIQAINAEKKDQITLPELKGFYRDLEAEIVNHDVYGYAPIVAQSFSD